MSDVPRTTRRRVGPGPAWVAGVIALVLSCVPGTGGAARADVPEALSGHGWLTYEQAGDERGRGAGGRRGPETLVLHAPPRVAPEDKTRAVLGFAPGFAQRVEATAWSGNSAVFVLGAEHRTGAGTVRSTARLTALRTAVGGYGFVPGRPEILPPLWGEVDVIGLAAWRDGAAVLLRQRDKPPEASMTPPVAPAPPGALILRSLTTSAWAQMPLPAGVSALAGRSLEDVRSTVRVVGQRGGVGLLVAPPAGEGAGGVLFTGGPEVLPEGVFGPPAPLVWRERALPLMLDGKRLRIDGAGFSLGATPGDDALIAWSVDGSTVRIVRLADDGPVELARISDVPEAGDGGGGGGGGCRVIVTDAPGAPVVPAAGVGSGGAGVGVGGVGRVIVTWGSPPATGAGGARRDQPRGKPEPIQLREVSVLTGEVLFSGPARNFQLISGTSFQAVAAGLLVLMVAVILFVLRAEPGRLPRLPEHLELASPIRRTLAGLIDYLPGALLAAQLLGLPPFALIRISQIVQLEQAMASLGLALFISMLLAAIGEAISGRSLGKAAMGLRVYSTPPSPPSPPAPGPRPTASEGEPETGGRGSGGEGGGGDPGGAMLEVGPVKPWQAAARNVVRWMIPVVSLLMMLDGGRRHPGDFAARTIVLQDRDEPEPPSEGEG